ncbi:MAG: VanZ family protein [Candidatus Cloacimonetes bacterium]|nr:VanZ family protein [Candidatus Cloacimonadota bacterium]
MLEGNQKKKFLTILFVFWCVIIFLLSVVPTDETPLSSITFIDKIAHFLQYLIFALLYYFMRSYQQRSAEKIIRELIFLSIIISITNEFIQIPIPGREFCLLDIAANFIGFLVVIIYLIMRTKKKKWLRNERNEK